MQILNCGLYLTLQRHLLHGCSVQPLPSMQTSSIAFFDIVWQRQLEKCRSGIRSCLSAGLPLR